MPNSFDYCYSVDCTVEEKIEAIAKRVYRADSVDILPAARKQMKKLQKLGFGKLPICMAKTQYSFSDDASLLGAPKGFKLTVRNLKV
jgi:formate--tetrahydrofolate ligase